MANSNMTPITVTVEGKAYTFRPLGTNALCALEGQLGKPFGAILGELGVMGLERMRLTTVRMFLQACMTEPMTEDAIGDVVDALGFDGISKAMNGLVWPAREMS